MVRLSPEQLEQLTGLALAVAFVCVLAVIITWVYLQWERRRLGRACTDLERRLDRVVADYAALEANYRELVAHADMTRAAYRNAVAKITLLAGTGRR